MKPTNSALFCAVIFTAATISSNAQTADLTPADQCMINAYQKIFAQKAATEAVVEIEIAPLQKECEEKTASLVKHPDILKKGLSDFSAGGTRFLFK